jgi:hypothetical protein
MRVAEKLDWKVLIQKQTKDGHDGSDLYINKQMLKL